MKMQEQLPSLPNSWIPYLGKAWSQLIRDNRKQLARADLTPPNTLWFRVLEMLAPQAVKVVILGQDPYHGAHQAEGLSFSVPDNQRVPPSLKNILKELAQDEGTYPVDHGNLSEWVEQGVLLLNSALTVPLGDPGAQLAVWEAFTDEVIRTLNKQPNGIVFLLWGAFAQSKGALVDADKHLVLTAAHPSPLSAHRGFFGCRHFSQANRWLEAHGQTAINWQLTPINPSLF